MNFVTLFSMFCLAVHPFWKYTSSAQWSVYVPEDISIFNVYLCVSLHVWTSGTDPLPGRQWPSGWGDWRHTVLGLTLTSSWPVSYAPSLSQVSWKKCAAVITNHQQQTHVTSSNDTHRLTDGQGPKSIPRYGRSLWYSSHFSALRLRCA